MTNYEYDFIKTVIVTFVVLGSLMYGVIIFADWALTYGPKRTLVEVVVEHWRWWMDLVGRVW